MKKILLIICILLLTSCAANNKPNIKKEKTFLGNITDESGDMILLLNTETYITTVNPELKEKLINTAKKEITRYHKLLDSHHYYLDDTNNRITNIKVLNDNIDKGPIKVDPIIIDALNESITLVKLTHGYFNITLGELSDLYSSKLLPYDSYNDDPSPNEIHNKLKGIINENDIDKQIIIDKENGTVELKSINGTFEIDLGAFSKGYIIEKVYQELIIYNTSFLLTAGSSSIVTYSSSKENISWNIGLKNPNNQINDLFSFNMNNGAISTSGDYEKYYYINDGTRRHHILNPKTGYSENFYHSNTFISSNAFVIDALSTALFNVENKNERNQIIKDTENKYGIDISYCLINYDNKIIMDQTFIDKINDKTLIENIEID